MIADVVSAVAAVLLGLKPGNEVVVVGLVDVQHQGSGIQVHAVL